MEERKGTEDELADSIDPLESMIERAEYVLDGEPSELQRDYDDLKSRHHSLSVAMGIVLFSMIVSFYYGCECSQRLQRAVDLLDLPL